VAISAEPPVDARWRKSSFSGTQGCVEVADTADAVWLRDSKEQQGPVLMFTRHEWTAFLAGVRAAEFDAPI